MTTQTQSLSSVLFWNIWGHRYPTDIHNFLREHAADTDILCLTEVTDVAADGLRGLTTREKHGTNPEEPPQHVDGYAQLIKQLDANYTHRYGASKRSDWQCEKTGITFPQVGFGSTMFLRKELRIVAYGDFLLCDNMDDVRPRLMQWVVYNKGNVRYLVAHFHGVWLAHNTKGDDPARLTQSHEFLGALEGVYKEHDVDKVVFGGDFNLDCNTKALALLKNTHVLRANTGPFRNLIDEFNIRNTRTTKYRKYGLPDESMFADYAFVSPNVAVTKFLVHTNEQASDHAPLHLTFH